MFYTTLGAFSKSICEHLCSHSLLWEQQYLLVKMVRVLCECPPQLHSKFEIILGYLTTLAFLTVEQSRSEHSQTCIYDLCFTLKLLIDFVVGSVCKAQIISYSFSFSPSSVWILGLKLRTPDASKDVYLMSHLTSHDDLLEHIELAHSLSMEHLPSMY